MPRPHDPMHNRRGRSEVPAHMPAPWLLGEDVDDLMPATGKSPVQRKHADPHNVSFRGEVVYPNEQPAEDRTAAAAVLNPFEFSGTQRLPHVSIVMGIDGLRQVNPHSHARRRGRANRTVSGTSPPVELPTLNSPHRYRSPATATWPTLRADDTPTPSTVYDIRKPHMISPVSHHPLQPEDVVQLQHQCSPPLPNGSTESPPGFDSQSIPEIAPRDTWRRAEIRRRHCAARVANQTAATLAAVRAERERCNVTQQDRLIVDTITAEAAAEAEAERMRRGAKRRVLGRVRREALYQRERAKLREAEAALQRERQEWISTCSKHQQVARAELEKRAFAQRVERAQREHEIRDAAALRGPADRAVKYGAEPMLSAVPLPGTRNGDHPDDGIAKERRRVAAESRRMELQHCIDASRAAAAMTSGATPAEANYGISTWRVGTPPTWHTGHGRRQFPKKRHGK